MVIFDSVKKAKVPFEPVRDNEARIYVCGPTVYDDAHLGHARSAVAFDLLRRTLTALGYKVTFARNITDIDDKIIAKHLETGEPIERITARYTERYLEEMGGKDILGPEPDARIPGLEHARALCHKDGIYSADTVLVPLEDGDRAQALKSMGKTVITIDLNPLSRTARTADITIVDNITRAVPRMIKFAEEMRAAPEAGLRAARNSFDNAEALREALEEIASAVRRL